MSAAASANHLFTEVKASSSKAAGKQKLDVKTVRALDQAGEEAILKKFDLDSTFGPCVGISRLVRWERAKRNGLNPPEDVLRLIQQNSGNPAYTENLWNERL